MIKFIIITCVILGGCTCDQYNCPKDDPNRVGAICNDGTMTDAVGRGACSHHGGVKEWRCCEKK